MDFFERTGKMAIGSRLRVLTEKLTRDAASIYGLYGVDLKPKWFPVFYSLTDEKPKSVTAIAREIGQSHPSVSTIVKEMIKAGIIEEVDDKADRRCTLITLTEYGKSLSQEVFFHGGISFEPYRGQYARLTDPARMRYLETYNASEGFFAVQSTLEPGSMLLLLDVGVFYEFIPLDAIDDPNPEAIPAWEVTPGETYALAITACNGLWRYMIGDTVRIVSADPLKIAIAGRTKHFINAFGEEVMVYNADAAIAEACRQTGASVANYTAAPVYDDGGHRGHHQWLIEWTVPPPDIADFASRLDRALQAVNSDYQAKRSGNIFLDCLTIDTAPAGLFDRWLESTGKLGGQRKIPRLANDRRIIDQLLKKIP